jgi:hypothetical protein
MRIILKRTHPVGERRKEEKTLQNAPQHEVEIK